MTLDFHLLWTLTGVGTVVFAALAAPTRRARAVMTAAFVAGAASAWWFGLPSSEAIGIAAAGGAVVLLLRPSTALVAPVLAGALAAFWGAMLAGQGLPLWLGVGVGAFWPIAVVMLARAATFAPPRLRDEALFLLSVLALVTAIVPGVQDGWQAAVNLSLQSSQEATAGALPVWTLTVGVSALLLGGLYSMWSRR